MATIASLRKELEEIEEDNSWFLNKYRGAPYDPDRHISHYEQKAYEYKKIAEEAIEKLEKVRELLEEEDQ